jgi:hypothetical protein
MAQALSPAQIKSLNAYIQGGARGSSPAALHRQLAERVDTLEKHLRPVLSDLERLGPPAQRRLSVVQDSLKVLQSTDLNVYNDRAWREDLVKQSKTLCCVLRAAAEPSQSRDQGSLRLTLKQERRRAKLDKIASKRAEAELSPAEQALLEEHRAEKRARKKAEFDPLAKSKKGARAAEGAPASDAAPATAPDPAAAPPSEASPSPAPAPDSGGANVTPEQGGGERKE